MKKLTILCLFVPIGYSIIQSRSRSLHELKRFFHLDSTAIQTVMSTSVQARGLLLSMCVQNFLIAYSPVLMMLQIQNS